MKPKLRPQKGWEFRVIVCDESGYYEVDDFWHYERAAFIAEQLMNDLRERQKEIQKEERVPQ